MFVPRLNISTRTQIQNAKETAQWGMNYSSHDIEQIIMKEQSVRQPLRDKWIGTMSEYYEKQIQAHTQISFACQLQRIF